MNFGTRVQTRTVSRQRYERMLQEELIKINEELIKINGQIAIANIRGDRTAHGCIIKPITYDEMAHSRKRVTAHGRFRIYRELRAMGFSFPSIALVSGKDHSSILAGIKVINLVEPLIAVSSPVEWTAENAPPRENVPPAELTGRTANLHQPLASIEVEMITVAA